MPLSVQEKKMQNNIIETIQKQFFKELGKGCVQRFEEINIPSQEKEEFSQYYRLLKNWHQQITTLSFLPDLPQELEEIFIHSPFAIILKTANEKIQTDTDLTTKDYQAALEVLALQNNQSWNIKFPYTSFYTEFRGYPVRMTLIHYSTSPEGVSKLFIRFLNKTTIPITHYSNDKSFYESIIQNKKNVLIAGATGSGKTTFINSLIGLIPKDEHVILIEDTQELIAPNSISTRLVQDEDGPNKTMNKYMSYAMRMSPDRIILGEMRSNEVETALLAINTGHNGFLSSIHANSAKDALMRMALLFKMYSPQDLGFDVILKLITNNIDYVVYIEDKKISDVVEVYGSEGSNIFFDSLCDKVQIA